MSDAKKLPLDQIPDPRELKKILDETALARVRRKYRPIMVHRDFYEEIVIISRIEGRYISAQLRFILDTWKRQNLSRNDLDFLSAELAAARVTWEKRYQEWVEETMADLSRRKRAIPHFKKVQGPPSRRPKTPPAHLPPEDPNG
jgi:hypothetical protein